MTKIIAGQFLRETFLAKNPQFIESDLVRRVESAWTFANNHRETPGLQEDLREGYRKGVLLLKINPEGFKRRTRALVDGDHLFGDYSPRVKGEAPRKRAKVLHVGELPDAKYVDAVLYSREVLAETNHVSDPTADYEIVTFLAKESEADEPMETEVLIHNHFGASGGSNTLMDDATFVKTLQASYEYWRGRAYIYG